MKRSNQAVLAVAAAAALVHASCGSDPARVGRPPIVQSYAPESRSLDGFVGDTLRFSLRVFDPDRDELTAYYELNGVPVAHSTRWDFVIADTGDVVVRGCVSDGEHTSSIQWRVARHRTLNHPPVILAAQPIETNPTLVVGNRLGFAVVADDPEDEVLAYTFSVNDSLVSNERQFSYQATSVGKKLVRVVVTDGEFAVAHDWQLKVTTEPDTIAPAGVPITFAATGTDPGEVDIEWMAVGRDGMIGRPSLYQVRTAPVPIDNEEDWSRASDHPGVPPPATPGETMRMTVGGLLPAKLTYVAVRAIDDFGNQSPLQPPVSVVTRGMRFGGHVIDASTGLGIAGVRVTFGYGVYTTGADGAYEFTELAGGEGTLAARDETVAEVGAYFDYEMPYTVHHEDVVDLVLLPNYPLQTTLYDDFLAFYRGMTDIGGSPHPAEQRRWSLPVSLYVRPFTKEGLDYAETLRRIAAEFDALVGAHVFEVVTTLPTFRVETSYSASADRDRYSVTTWTPDWYPQTGLIEFRTLYTPASLDALEVTARHEFGHALGLNHSVDDTHIMFGGHFPSADFFTPDEVTLLRCFYRVPRGWDARRFQRD